jgi:ABC-type multidrug transport system ATPase subunit
VTALDSLDLHVERGTTLAVVGPNGAGKSTLFGVIAGLVRPDRGSVRIDGRTPGDRVRTEGIGVLPDRVRLPERRCVAEALRRLAIIDRCPRREISSRVDLVMEMTGLVERRDSRCGGLSRGLRQRLGLAQLLIRPRSLLLLDEPLSGLDPLWRARFRELLEWLRAERPDLTILLASHELGEVGRIADRLVVIRAGRIVSSLEVDDRPAAMETRVLEILQEARVE